MHLIIPYAVTIFLFLGSAVMGVSGCAGETNRKSPSQEVNEFFVAGKEAQYLALQCPTSGSMRSIRLCSPDGGQISSHFPGRCLEEALGALKIFCRGGNDPGSKPEEVEGPGRTKPGIAPTAKKQAVANDNYANEGEQFLIFSFLNPGFSFWVVAAKQGSRLRSAKNPMIKDLFKKSVLIFGCGNILWGDDGFGPAVIERLKEHYRLPDDVLAMDVGTSIRDILFDLVLSDKKPEKIFIIDAVEYPDRKPGEVFEIPVEGIPDKKPPTSRCTNFPTVNMLQELKEHSRIDIKIIVAQVEAIPDEVQPGLSPSMTSAIDTACLRLMAALPGEGCLMPSPGLIS